MLHELSEACSCERTPDAIRLRRRFRVTSKGPLSKGRAKAVAAKEALDLPAWSRAGVHFRLDGEPQAKEIPGGYDVTVTMRCDP